MSRWSLLPSTRGRRARLLPLAPIAALALAVPAAPAAAAADAAPSGPFIVTHGLNNPRQLSFDSQGRLLVAEAGRGGSACSGSGQNATCVGTTGSISRIADPAHTQRALPSRVVTGLISAAGPDGTFAVGSDGVSSLGNRLYIAMTYAPPDVIPHPLPAKQLGKLLVAVPGGHASIAGDVTGVEFQCPNCDGYRDPKTHKPELDSNPYSALALPGGTLVADAAGNDIIRVLNGHARLYAVLPRHGGAKTDRQPTPTALAKGPGNTILVGELAHEEPGAARIDVLRPGGGYLGFIGKGGSILNVPGGLSTITGVAYDGKAYYVSQLEAGNPQLPGLLTRIDAKTGKTTSVAVPFPAGVAADGHGNVYVAAWSIATAKGAFGAPMSSGQVWRYRM